jgi:integrase
MKPQLIHSAHTDNFIWLPDLPSRIRYFDDFNECYVSIEKPKGLNIWEVVAGGKVSRLDFNCHPQKDILLIKSWVAFLLVTLAPTTVIIRFESLLRVSPGDVDLIVSSTPKTILSVWRTLNTRSYSALEISSLKSILNFFAYCNLGQWSSANNSFLSTLPLPAKDKYASVRTGDVFLTVHEEAQLIEYFDYMTQIIKTEPSIISFKELIAVSTLLCSYQFGLRPMQISKLQMRDVRIWDEDGQPSVHLTFRMIKQRSERKSFPLLRRVKHEWAPLFVELHSRAIQNGLSGADRIFNSKNSQETAQLIVKTTASILTESRCATELRHTAAQRLVDSGASEEELAEFLGHSDIDTGLVYFQTSPNQAERVNKALGLSTVYQKVLKIAHQGFITEHELSSLKQSEQIAGVPHGIPIAGIGGCSSGQPACPYNPVTACYGCRKFMPVNNIEIHKKALEDFRQIITFFASSGREGESNPTFQQLTKTISCVQSIISEIEDANE